MAAPEIIQRLYYEKDAAVYDLKHSSEPEHQTALSYISPFIDRLEISSVLDVGSGTGRGLKYFLKKHPNVDLFGVECVTALLDQARGNGVDAKCLIKGSGKALPFADGSFDAVCEFAVLHHVSNPNVVVSEMVRVARKAIFLSDCNRFGQGSLPAKLLKLLLFRSGLWNVTNYFLTRGKRFRFSEGDGLFYSYSVFDSYSILADWADKVILIPTTDEKSESWFGPLLTSKHILVCALREGKNGAGGRT